VKTAKRVSTRSRLRRAVLTLALVALPAACLPAGATAAEAGPAWAISASLHSPTNLIRGDTTGREVYLVEATNIGSKATFGPVTITDYLPPGLTLNEHPTGSLYEIEAISEDPLGPLYPCEVVGALVRCTYPVVVHPGERLYLVLPVNVSAEASAIVTNQATVIGGNAPGASTSVQAKVSSEPATFGIQSFTNAFLDAGAGVETRAGSHPYQMRISAQFNTNPSEGLRVPPAENPRNISADLPAGVVLNPRATRVRCREAELEAIGLGEGCPKDSIVGTAHVTIGFFGSANDIGAGPLYNMVPAAGVPAEFAFNPSGLESFIHLLGRVRSDGDYGLSSDTLDATQFGSVSGVTIDLWGHPADPSHDFRRCPHYNQFLEYGIACSVGSNETPLITMPSACSGPLTTTLSADSWQHHGSFVSSSVQTEDAAGNPVGVTGCDKLGYAPSTESIVSTDQAGTGTGFDFNVDFPNNGLNNTNALAESMTTKGVVTLPEGVTINPSVGEGLGFCKPDQYARETAFSIDGEGCPADSKVGTLHLTSPLVDEALDGSVYLAQQDNPATTTPGAENPFDTDIALYLVLRNPILGVIVKKPLKLEADPITGRLTASLDGVPQLPFSHFNFHFKEGARAALITPSACGKYTTVAKLYPSADPTHPKVVTSDFEITKGVGGGPCPPGGVPPFHPEFQAGAVNNNAGAFSPFNMRLTRHDGEQDMTKFSSILPPGELGSLAGVGKCPDSAIALAKTKTGRQEEASPSCPANSLIGHTLAGAGVGDSLTYVPGQLYLGGPYHGDPLSVISITPGVAGPFDAGAIVVQLALNLNSKTAEVEVDGANSDPIPHILKGIVLKVRDLRVYVDRPNFTLNPTSCDPSTVKGTLFGAYLNVFDPSDDVPAPLATRYQAADCQNLGYKPSLDLHLKGGTRRGGHPGLLATYKARPGDANTKGIVVRLPRSAFLDQAHIRTICTRVQFAAKSCPPAAQYGYIKAFTPLLDEPLEGPVWLRSSNHKLPDLVFDLHGLVDVEVSTRIDSAHGGIRASIENAPDAPLNKVVLRMQGGKKGLIVNSRNLCDATSRANVEFEGQNGKQSSANPVMKADCGGKRKHKRHRG
jgi:hypothetical protein